MRKKTGSFFLWLFGWKVKGRVPTEAECPKLIVVTGPHTSFIDFPVGLFVRMAEGRHIYYLAKNSLFFPPLGWILRWLGGYPVDRSEKKGLVNKIVEMFDNRDKFAITITPEGTRKRTTRLKSGFYHIARQAKVPLQLAGMDFGTRTVTFSEPFMPGDNYEVEEEKIRKFWGSMKALYPKKGFQ